MCAHGKGDTPFPPFPDPTTHSHLSVDVHLPPQVAQRADQRLRLAVDAHPHPVDKDLGRVGDDTVKGGGEGGYGCEVALGGVGDDAAGEMKGKGGLVGWGGAKGCRGE